MPDSRTAACARLRDGIAAAPQMIAGDRRMCSAVAAGFGSKITAKTGAEGVYAAAFHDYGLGLMVKARDGNGRASDAALGAVIHALGYDLPQAVRDFTLPVLRNWAGQTVGEIRIEGPLALS
jgi:L-asparaginase II